MFKFIYLISSLLFITALYILPCHSHRCIHDKAALKAPVSLKRSIKYHDIKAESYTDPKLFEPLIIHFYTDILEKTVTKNTIYNIQIALQKIKILIKKTFQVRKRKKPFVLERESCTHRWQVGRNRGKCSEYHGEIEECSARGLMYQIPARFVDKLEIYEFFDPNPRLLSQSGPGLLESNFVAFITSENTDFCEEEDVSAHGSYCRTDRNTNEPLAGIINLCPASFHKIFPADYYYNVLLHELFHILGFSSSLFERFLPCKKGIYCDIPKHIVQEDSDGIPRMMYPLVVQNTQKHFNCSRDDFGAPMDMPTNETGVQFYNSHWHPVLMYSSIMSPKFSEFDKIYVDNITLAVFASTGWYRINFEQADKFPFGLNEGCSFGIGDSCDDSLYLCDPSVNKTGCDLENKAIARCTSLVSYHPCGVYQPFSTEDCETDANKQFGLDLFSLGYIKRCFMLNSSESIEPTCLPVKCVSRENYELLINMTWYQCNSSELAVTENSTLHCPELFSHCLTAQLTGASQFLCSEDTQFFIAVRMYFSLPEFDILSEYQSFKNFKVTALRGIAEKIKMPVNFIVNSSLSVFKQIFLDFAICPPSDFNTVELTDLLTKIQSFLNTGSFLRVLKGHTDLIISSSDVKINPTDLTAFSDHDGFRALVIFPAYIAIFLIATFIASIIRLIHIRSRRPQRTIEQQSSNIEMS